ncbi:MTH1187 family thiamine-binding protein [Dactylosporangium sp. CA-139066]|uniref:MTH1187 family thiamine-binding protein n=1 Tax=Dactylosporangium sp. CA-139066 TaxID=3239930 RepID=UPI003D900EF3
MSVLVAFSVTPIGSGSDVGELVAAAVRVVRDSGLPNRTDAMFTTVEGETWEEVMAVVQAAVAVVQAASPRTSTVIKVDWREGPVGRLESKVASVERHLA